MKPVVSSLVALLISVAPLSAMAAKPTHAAHAKTAHVVKKADKSEKSSTSAAAEKSESEKTIVRVKAGKKDGASAKPAMHHAHNVDLGGAGHKEPKVGHDDHGGALVSASMTAKIPATIATPVSGHGKTAHAKPVAAPKSASEMPKLPSPNAGKPSKGGAEKGARKPSEKKSDASGDDTSGEPTRDEELAELVARIRGLDALTSDKSEDRSGGTKSAKNARNVAHTTTQKACAKDPVEIVRGPEIERFELTNCDGTPAPLALEHLSVMIRPGGAARPTAPLAELARKTGPDLAPGIRRVDARLVERIQAVVDHFGKPGAPAKMFVISGYRPASIGSMHSTGRAVDFRIDGAKNEDIVAFCKTLGDTGCGFYPNSSFVHIDVRDAGAGHVTWIDASGPGETPRYVSAWPPPQLATRKNGLERAGATEAIPDLAAEGESLLRARRPFEHDGESEGSSDEHAD